MAKYDPLRRYLRQRGGQDVTLSFIDIERIIGAMLPKAALDPGWWSNAPGGGRGFVQCDAWLGAGYVAIPVERTETVRFQCAAAHAARREAG